jgi:hypothetical protein
VVSRTHVECGVSEFEEFLPKGASEDPIPIRYDDGWHTMKFVYVVKESLSNRQSCIRVSQTDEMGIFSEFVNDDKNGIKGF